MQQLYLQPSAPGAGRSGTVARRRVQAVKTGRKEGCLRARERQTAVERAKEE